MGWWIAFYPGTLSYDSIMYVWQVSTGNWTTQHSVLYNAFVWLSLQASGQLAVLTLAQTVAMAGGLAYAVIGLRRLRVSGRWLVIAAGAAVCLPVVGTFTVYVSKDVAFAVTQVWLLGTVARLLAARPAGLNGRPANRLWFALLAEFVLIGLFRQNGFVVIALTTAGLAVVLAGTRWRVLACGAAAIVVGFVANLAVYPALGVRRVGPELLLGPVYADIAVAYADRPAAFTGADIRLLALVAPLEYWRSTANCYNADATITYANDRFNFAVARQHQTELVQLWLSLISRIPDEVTSTRLCRGSIAWNPFPGPTNGRIVKVPIGGVGKLYAFPPEQLAQSPFRHAIRSAPISGLAHAGARSFRRLTDIRAVEWLAWRGATWCYVAYLAVILFAKRQRDLPLLGLAAIVAANQLNVLLNNPDQLVRYMTAPIILGILLLPLAFVSRPRPQISPHRAGKGTAR
ncbi:MAG: hypothetical protein QOE61_2848 [Micromonosporaceae bacterium]|nr:hypothetical protein [Micromonosporaceae bacterium]